MPTSSVERVRIHGHDLSYRRAGDGNGPVLLMIHGIAGSSATWEASMPLLARDFTIIAPDMLGHGQSAKPLGDYSLGAYASGLRDLLAVLDINRATLVGHSLGGGIAMQLAYQHPECCERMVLVDSGGLGSEVSWLLRLMSLPGADVLAPLFFPRFVREWGDAVGRLASGKGLRSARVSESWRSYASLVEAPNRQAFVRTLRHVIAPSGQSVSANDRLYLLERVPTMIMWGDRDGIIPVDHARAAHEAIPHSRLEIIEGAGHFPHVEEPGVFASLLADFVATTTAAAVGSEEFVATMQAAGGRLSA
ncbi:MAG: alpha/beta fold hydrolase [Actinomycetota bacterium]|nr:alpha/beta fold hydrolase [Actinomycetota bacterium]